MNNISYEQNGFIKCIQDTLEINEFRELIQLERLGAELERLRWVKGNRDKREAKLKLKDEGML